MPDDVDVRQKEKSVHGPGIKSVKSQRKLKYLRHQIQCVPEDADTDLWATQIPINLQSERCEELITNNSLYARSEGDLVSNGVWKCQKDNKNLTLENHNVLGAKCYLTCDSGFEVISDGEKRRCRFHGPTDELKWSGRIRHCRTPEENARILAREKLE